MSFKIPKYIAELKPYSPGKPIEELEREYQISSAIKLASNENPFGPSPRATGAIRACLQNLHRYPDGSGYDLKRALGLHLGVEPEAIVLGNGSDEIIDLVLRTFVQPEDEVVVTEPCFLIYELMSKARGARLVKVPLVNLRCDLQGMRRAVTPRTRVIFLNNPHNPTGSVLAADEFERFCALLPEGVLLVLDEAYIEFAAPGSTVTGIDYLAAGPPLLVLRTFSKAYGLAGLRVGYGVGSRDVVQWLERLRLPFNVNSLALAAAAAALEDRDFLLQTVAKIREGLLFLQQECRRLGLQPYPSQANFVLVDINREARPVYEKMLRHGVIVRPMDSYGLPRCLRITVGTAAENRRCVQALETALLEVADP